MCGIVGYIGKDNAPDVLIDGLRRLEYRGYDSAGVVVFEGKDISIRRSVGKLSGLEALLRKSPLTGTVGIGHTRWATHGSPTEENAHPHRDADGRVVVVHNGIIENYLALKQELTGRGAKFVSQTDTEVVAHLIAFTLKDMKVADEAGYVDAVRRALLRLKGAYALGIVCRDFPDIIVGARQEAPLCFGLGKEGEYILASDVTAFLSRTREAVILDDGELVVLSRKGYRAMTIVDGKAVAKKAATVTWDAIQAEKSGYRHFMLKEIHEQPQSIEDTLRGRLVLEDWGAHLGNLKLAPEQVKGFEKIVIVACGTSWHAGLVGKYLIESWVKAPVSVDIASEFRYRDPLIGPKDLLITISQSGETADTIAALRHAKAQGARTLSICNVAGSTLAREAHGKVLTHCGPEIGVASTKAFTAQLTVLYLLALYGAHIRGTLPKEKAGEILESLLHLPRWVAEAVKNEAQVVEVAKKFSRSSHFLFLGRHLNYPIALEGALKLKEISYIHAEGYPSGELKHGPIALIDENMPVVAIATQSAVYDKVISNVEEVKARGGQVILVATKGDARAKALCDHVIEVPEAPEWLAPVVNVVPLQLLAYHIAVLRGCDVDQPRNLAKSVTVE